MDEPKSSVLINKLSLPGALNNRGFFFALTGGTVTDDGDALVTEYGICWST